ncbi:hypothetical protein BX070DRAFT_71624 [Coemansia spiralis]|nr:hypothetical protein BX070DRAFT_71624 [Coemansia spiralis]
MGLKQTREIMEERKEKHPFFICVVVDWKCALASERHPRFIFPLLNVYVFCFKCSFSSSTLHAAILIKPSWVAKALVALFWPLLWMEGKARGRTHVRCSSSNALSSIGQDEAQLLAWILFPSFSLSQSAALALAIVPTIAFWLCLSSTVVALVKL